jgi:hypothetical protein
MSVYRIGDRIIKVEVLQDGFGDDEERPRKALLELDNSRSDIVLEVLLIDKRYKRYEYGDIPDRKNTPRRSALTSSGY